MPNIIATIFIFFTGIDRRRSCKFNANLRASTLKAAAKKPLPLLSRTLDLRALRTLDITMLTGAEAQALESVASSIKACFGPNGEHYSRHKLP